MDRCSRWFYSGDALAFEHSANLTQTVTAGDPIRSRSPGNRDSCPVCGIFVPRHPEPIGQIVIDNGTVLFSDRARALFRRLLSPRSPGLDSRSGGGT